MKIVQIWYGACPDAEIVDCMRHNEALGHEYVLCSHDNFLDAEMFVSVDELLQCSGIGSIVAGIERGNKLLATVDLLRMWIAANEPVLYLDADCMLTGDVALQAQATYFVQRGALAVDYYAFYSGDTSFFELIYNRVVANTGRCYRTTIFFEEINREKQRIKTFEQKTFHHVNKQSWCKNA
jgi:hypothetical protein